MRMLGHSAAWLAKKDDGICTTQGDSATSRPPSMSSLSRPSARVTSASASNQRVFERRVSPQRPLAERQYSMAVAVADLPASRPPRMTCETLPNWAGSIPIRSSSSVVLPTWVLPNMTT